MDKQTQKRLYFEMARIRAVEEAVADEYGKKEMRCPVHLSIGQEAVPVGICAHLTKDDKVYSTHRCHAHYLAKGGDLNAMIAELHGKVTGCCRGKGGSMHLVDVSKGMMGSSALVAGTIPLSVGSAFSLKLSGTQNVAIAYFGDGGSEEGILYESLNFAALHKLPVLFACENNFYATYSHQDSRQATRAIEKRGDSFGVPGFKVDGYDISAVYDVAEKAVKRARDGQGPTLIEFVTYRWRDHVGPDFDIQVGYRTKEEVDSWIEKCPLENQKTALLKDGTLSEAEEKDFRSNLDDEIAKAFDFARSSPLPEKEAIFTDVYA